MFTFPIFNALFQTKSLGKANNGQPKVALVVGVTGIVGNSLAKILSRPDAPGGPWKVYGIARRPQPRYFAESPIEYIQCNVFDAFDTQEKISSLRDVTHLFWVMCVGQRTEERNFHDGNMFRNVIDALLLNARSLQHIVLQTGGEHYFGSFTLDRMNEAIPEPPFQEDLARLPISNIYYTLEDILFDIVKKKEALTWSIHRPNAILGFSPWSLMNVLGSLAVYASICKFEGSSFTFPGNRVTWEQCGDVADAELIAEQEIWACLEPNAKNQAFNISNGDVFSYKRVWSLLATQFGLEVPPYNEHPISLQEAMKGKDDVWDAIVAKYDLIPTKLENVGNWWLIDHLLNLPYLPVLSMNKSKGLGFLGYRDTEASILHWIDSMRLKKIIP